MRNINNYRQGILQIPLTIFVNLVLQDPQSYVVLKAPGQRAIPMVVKDKPIILIAVQEQGDLKINNQPLNGYWTNLYETADLTGSGSVVVLIPR